MVSASQQQDEGLDVIVAFIESGDQEICVSYQNVNLECRHINPETSTSETFNGLPVPPHRAFKVCSHEVDNPDKVSCTMGTYDPDGLFEVVSMKDAMPILVEEGEESESGSESEEEPETDQ